MEKFLGFESKKEAGTCIAAAVAITSLAVGIGLAKEDSPKPDHSESTEEYCVVDNNLGASINNPPIIEFSADAIFLENQDAVGKIAKVIFTSERPIHVIMTDDVNWDDWTGSNRAETPGESGIYTVTLSNDKLSGGTANQEFKGVSEAEVECVATRW